MKFLTKRSFSIISLAFLICSAAFTQSLRPVVNSIEARAVSSTKIIVSWKLPEKTEGSSISSLLVYKDTKPIIGRESIEKLTPLATLPWSATSYTDIVKDFHEYYYAVLSLTREGSYEHKEGLYFDEDLDTVESTDEGELLMVILPGVNTTVNGVRVKSPVKKNEIPQKTTESAKERLYEKDEMREQPLPFIDILGSANIPDHKISTKAEKEALGLVGGKQTHLKKEPMDVYFFEEDMVSPPGGDEYLLFEVLRTSFVKGRYKESIAALNKFLSQRRTEETTNRATFYIAEAYYFSGDFEEAVNTFVVLSDVYPALTRKWIESALELYQLPEDQR